MASPKEASAREIYELKQRAIQYYQENEVPQKMEDILNSTFYDNPNDIFGHLANYFETFAKVPTISKVKAREVLDSRGQPTIQTDIYCVIKNFEKHVGSSVMSSENFFSETSRQEDRDEEDLERQKFVDAAISYINGLLNDTMADFDPTKQAEGDEIIFSTLDKIRQEEEAERKKAQEESGEPAEPVTPTPRVESAKAKAKSPKGKKGAPPVVIIPDEPREKLLCGCNAMSSLSQALIDAGAFLSGVPLYQHIAHVRFGEVPEKFSIPAPMMTILAGGKAALGKSNGVKEYMLVPVPGMPLKESFKHMSNVYNYIAKSLALKGGSGARLVNDTGALCPMLDRAEQGIDMIQEALTQLGLSLGEHFNIALNLAGQEIFDFEKGKYEVIVGQQKDAEQLGDYWSEILGRYPAVNVLIDPMRKQDKEGWLNLCDKVTERCFVAGEFVYHRPGRLREEELDQEFKTSAVVLRLEQMTTVSDILQAAKKMEDAENQVILSTSLGESPSTFLADLAVGSNARFIKLGAPCRGERVAKINRLLQIEAELEDAAKLNTHGEYTYPHIAPPPPPPEDPEVGSQSGGVASEEGRKSESPSKKGK